MKKQKRICPSCNSENTEDANYCEFCGTKISEICPACWKKDGQPNRCPETNCGRKYVLEKC